MTFDDIVKDVSDECPPFNNFALRDFVREQINDSPAFPALVFEEGFKFVNTDLELVSVNIMSPEERVKFELCPPGKITRAKIPLTVSHLRLVKYRFRFGDQYVDSNLYTPYMFEDMLHVRGKPAMVRKVILEKTLSRVSEKDKDGLSVSPIRVNLTFNRRNTFRIVSYVNNASYSHFIVTARLWHGSLPAKFTELTILHYMLAKFGFPKTLTKFGLTKSDISFVTEVDQSDTEIYEYFAARKFDDKIDTGPGLFLKVRKTLLGEDLSRMFIVNLLYVLHPFHIQNIDNVYVEDSWHTHLSIWKVILGIIILGNRVEANANSNAESHLNSVDHFIDPLTKTRFEKFGIPINDIYDLLIYIFNNISLFMVRNRNQDLYNSRLDVANGVFVKSFAEKIFKPNLYQLAKKSNITIMNVRKHLKFNPMLFRQSTSSRSDDDKDYLAPPEIVGDNYLFSGGLNKIRLGGRPEQRLDPSMLVVESICAIVGKTIGKTGYVNPFIPTDENGAIIHPDYAAEIDQISRYLPR